MSLYPARMHDNLRRTSTDFVHMEQMLHVKALASGDCRPNVEFFADRLTCLAGCPTFAMLIIRPPPSIGEKARRTSFSSRIFQRDSLQYKVEAKGSRRNLTLTLSHHHWHVTDCFPSKLFVIASSPSFPPSIAITMDTDVLRFSSIVA